MICCQEDLHHFPVVGGSLNTYLGIHENPTSLKVNGRSILIWHGERADDPKPSESSSNDEIEVVGGGYGDTDDGFGGSDEESDGL